MTDIKRFFIGDLVKREHSGKILEIVSDKGVRYILGEKTLLPTEPAEILHREVEVEIVSVEEGFKASRVSFTEGVVWTGVDQVRRVREIN